MRFVLGFLVAIVAFFGALILLGGRAGSPEIALVAVLALTLGWFTARAAGHRGA